MPSVVLSAAFALLVLFVLPSAADYRLCALRSGPSGPCTCVADKPGEFVVAPGRLCKKAPPADKAAAKPEQAPKAESNPPAKTEAAQAAAPAEPAAPVEAAAPAPETPKASQAPEPENPAAEKQAVSSAPAQGRLAEVKARGKLVCGINPNLLGFSLQNDSGQWIGIDVDFCRALAGAIFSDASKVEFVPLETNERFEALKSGKIDVLSRNTTWTMGREVEMGLEFAGVLYFDGQGFMTSDERGLVSAQQLAGTSVCVEQGTTTADNMAFYFKSHQIEVEIKPFATRAELVKAYQAGTCDAYSGDRSSLFADRAGFENPGKHAVLPEVISKEPLGPVVLKVDRTWAEIVRWTLAGLVNAEEVGLTRAVATGATPPKGEIERLLDGAGHNGEQLGLPRSWLKDAVAAAGNYGEMFDANLGKTSPLGMDRGINALWKRGGILYAPPMW